MVEENTRNLPANELDLNLMLTDSVWGKQEVSQELREKLSKFHEIKGEDGKSLTDPEGNVYIKPSSLWGLLGFFTRDMRLANLSDWNNELQTCRYMIDLANDLLAADMAQPFIISLSRAATILETSQSKGGFLRRTMNTLRQEHINQQLEPPKKGFFGGNSKQQGYGGYQE